MRQMLRDVAAAVVALAGLGWLASSDAAWFPMAWAQEFYVAKCLVGVAAVVSMVAHMNRAWPHIGSTAQRLRYLLLLAFVTVVGAASTAQYEAGVPVTGRNIAGFVLAALTIPVAVVSIRQDRQARGPA